MFHLPSTPRFIINRWISIAVSMTRCRHVQPPGSCRAAIGRVERDPQPPRIPSRHLAAEPAAAAVSHYPRRAGTRPAHHGEPVDELGAVSGEGERRTSGGGVRWPWCWSLGEHGLADAGCRAVVHTPLDAGRRRSLRGAPGAPARPAKQRDGMTRGRRSARSHSTSRQYGVSLLNLDRWLRIERLTGDRGGR